jgi:hypothetical protein
MFVSEFSIISIFCSFLGFPSICLHCQFVYAV